MLIEQKLPTSFDNFKTLITEEISVKVAPEYIGGQIDNDQTIFTWAYHITIENNSANTVQIINRQWIVVDENGKSEEVSGSGVVGQQPIITSFNKFEYSSGIQLNTSSGIMSGHFSMRRSDDKIIQVKIPSFSLDIPLPIDTIH